MKRYFKKEEYQNMLDHVIHGLLMSLDSLEEARDIYEEDKKDAYALFGMYFYQCIEYIDKQEYAKKYHHLIVKCITIHKDCFPFYECGCKVCRGIRA